MPRNPNGPRRRGIWIFNGSQMRLRIPASSLTPSGRTPTIRVLKAVDNDIASHRRRGAEPLGGQGVRTRARRSEQIRLHRAPQSDGQFLLRSRRRNPRGGAHRLRVFGTAQTRQRHVDSPCKSDRIETPLLFDQRERIHARERPSVRRAVALIDVYQSIGHSVSRIRQQNRVGDGEDRSRGAERAPDTTSTVAAKTGLARTCGRRAGHPRSNPSAADAASLAN